MADHVDITLWVDRRWKDAIEKHLKGETLQEHLENVLDELCNQLPEREYDRISAEIYAEDAAEREAREAARTYAAYMYLKDRSNSAGSCWPGIKTIARDMNLSRSTVKRALADLEQHGYLAKLPRYRPNGSNTSNLYTLK